MREGWQAALLRGTLHVLGVRPRLSLARLACRSPLRLPQGLCCLPLGGSRLARVEVEVEVGARWGWSG
eukprot:scaffold44123_cov48-Phaeocystis_antarctica.AAC.1